MPLFPTIAILERREILRSRAPVEARPAESLVNCIPASDELCLFLSSGRLFLCLKRLPSCCWGDSFFYAHVDFGHHASEHMRSSTQDATFGGGAVTTLHPTRGWRANPIACLIRRDTARFRTRIRARKLFRNITYMREHVCQRTGPVMYSLRGPTETAHVLSPAAQGVDRRSMLLSLA